MIEAPNFAKLPKMASVIRYLKSFTMISQFSLYTICCEPPMLS